MHHRHLSHLAGTALLSLAILLAPSGTAFAQNKHTLPLFVSASHTTLQSFVRVINRSDTAGDVTIYAYDDDGERHGPVTLSLDANATAHFNSDSLRDGDVSKGLSGGIGDDGEGSLRLELETELDIEPLAYTRPKGQGFLTSTHDIVENTSMVWNVPFFNPGSQTVQQSRLRVINVSGIDTEVMIEGLDDKGAPGTETVSFDLPANAARTLSAQELEEGSDDATFDGKLGDGDGKWQLFVSASRPILVLSLLRSSQTGNMTNLSTATADNILGGTRGDDELFGGNGNDILNPGHNDLGHDIVHGSAGDDRIVYTDSGVSAYQELTYSSLGAGRIVVTIDGNTNRATIDKGSAGTDTIVDIANPLNAAVVSPFGGFGLYGTPFDDTYHLTVDNQWMQVGGGAGNDTFNLQIGGHGGVAIDYRDATNGIRVDLSAGAVHDDGFGDRDTISGPGPVVLGSEFSDVMVGDENNNTFMGRQGDDNIDGGGGSDSVNFSYLAGSPGYSVSVDNLYVDLEEGTATGTWNGSAFSYRIANIENVRGHMSNDTLRGSAGNNRLRGLGGDDTLRGEAGDDRLEGGNGNDIFVFGPGHGNDTIADFTNGEDRIDLNELSLTNHSDVTSTATSGPNGGVYIDLSSFGGGTITLLGFSLTNLDPLDFLL